MNFFTHILARWRCFRLGGHVLKFVRNIHGDEINYRDGMRSVWRCTKCGCYKDRPDLHYPETP